MDKYEIATILAANKQLTNDALAYYYDLRGDYMATPEEYQMLRDNHDSAIPVLIDEIGIVPYIAGWLSGVESVKRFLEGIANAKPLDSTVVGVILDANDHDEMVRLIEAGFDILRDATKGREYTFGFEGDAQEPIDIEEFVRVNEEFSTGEMIEIIQLEAGKRIVYGGGSVPISFLERVK